MISNRPYTFDRVVRAVLSISSIIGAIWVVHYLREALIPFAIAFLLAYLINPLVEFYCRKTEKRALSVFLALGTVALALGLGGWLLIPRVTDEVKSMVHLVQQMAEDKSFAQRAQDTLPPVLWEQLRALADDAHAQVEGDNWKALIQDGDMMAVAQKVLQKVLPGVFSVVKGAASVLLGLMGGIVILMYLVFMLLDYQKVKDESSGLIPPHWREPLVTLIKNFNIGMHRYFRAQALVAFLVGIVFAIGFSLIGLPMGVVFGLFVGALNMVPYLQLAALLPAAMLAIVASLEGGGGIGTMLLLTGGVFAAAQLIQDAVLVPRIMGDVTGLSPAMILLSLSVWGQLLGLLGLIVALPITCLLLAYYRDWMEKQVKLDPVGDQIVPVGDQASK